MLAVTNRVIAVMIPVIALVAYKLPQSPKLYIEDTVSKAIVTKSEAKQKRRHFTFMQKLCLTTTVLRLSLHFSQIHLVTPNAIKVIP